jgi:anti-sigma factor RsiW
MKQRCRKYTQETINRFVDKELAPDKTMEFSSHLERCPDCADQVAEFRKLGIVFNTHVTNLVAGIKGSSTDMAGSRDPQKSHGLVDRYFSGMTHHLYIKLASLTAVAALLIVAVFQGTPPTGPSAIVKSLDTNASSVMIIETKKEKHTIIWFSETDATTSAT